jgi:hypothetical protein
MNKIALLQRASKLDLNLRLEAARAAALSVPRKRKWGGGVGDSCEGAA